MRRAASLMLIGWGLASGTLVAPAAAERLVVAASRTAAPVRVDGVLDEPQWSSAAPITGLRLIFQREGAAPSESTDVRVLFDDQNLYFGIRCANRGPGAVRASLAPRDQILDGDHISVHLDTYRDKRRAYIFGINPYGVQLDGILDGSEPDFSWDAVWDGASTRGPAGWDSEMAIPLRSMRFPSDSAGVWGLWIRREITKDDEVCTWPLWRQADQGDIMLQAGDLTGLVGLRSAGHLDVEPYLSSVSTRVTSYFHESPAPSDLQSVTDSDLSRNVGLDLRYPITTSLVANATVNPDYSQVEADAIQIDVNQRYPLFFPEKRPFFLEGAEIFATPLDLVYTRRIADPLAGGKLTGKVGRWNLGAIALRDDGGGSTEGVGADNGADASRAGEFYIGRTAYDFGDNSRLGLLVAAHRTENEIDGVFPAVIPAEPVPQGGHNVVVAGDSRLRLGRGLFFNGQLAWSESRVNLSADYAGQNVFAGRNTSDIAYHASLRYADGVRDIETYQDYLGPEFRDESGFIERVDIRTTGINSSLMLRPENAWLRSWQPILNAYVIHDHEGVLQNAWVSPMIDWAFQKQTTMHTMYVRSRERWLDRDYDLNTYIFRFGNTLWRPLALSFDGSVGDGIFYGDTVTSFKGWNETYTFGATVRPDARFTMELTATRNRFSTRYGGDEVFDIWALGAKTTFQFTRAIYVRLYPQYDTGRHHLDADALLAFVLHPGTALYVGVNGDLDRIEDQHRPTQKVLFFKASYRFGI